MENIARRIIFEAEKLSSCTSVIIAIDGRCGSGKSTLSQMISSMTGAPVIHMDHFFLRPEMRTPERLDLPGGNSDIERFLSEVLIPLRNFDHCTYRPYDCKNGDFGDPIEIKESPIYIIDGSYSCHPDLWEYYDLHVFLSVSPDKQIRRISMRNGENAVEAFRSRWIPMEEKYFTAFGIADKCELVFDT